MRKSLTQQTSTDRVENAGLSDQDAAGAIVYTDVPDVTITQGQGPIYLNLDNAGQNEFAIAAFQSPFAD